MLLSDSSYAADLINILRSADQHLTSPLIMSYRDERAQNLPSLDDHFSSATCCHHKMPHADNRTEIINRPPHERRT